MLCEQVMKRNLHCLSPRDTVEMAARKMKDENIGFLPICDQSRKVLGTLTDRDIVIRLVAMKKPMTTMVEELMTREMVVCSPKDDIHKAEQLMVKNHKSRIMCVEQGNVLVGVISLSDLAEHERGTGASDTLRGIAEREVRH